MATIYLVDYENVNDLGLTGIHALPGSDQVYIIYTDNANRIGLDYLCEISVPVSAVRVEKGDQSLDMHLVSMLGYLIGCEEDPGTSYVIISQDSHFLTVAGYWCDRFNDDSKVTVLPSICGKPIYLNFDTGGTTWHDQAAVRIRKLIRKQGTCGENGWSMTVGTLCALMNTFPPYNKEKERLNLKGKKLLATFGDVLDIRQVNNVDLAFLKEIDSRQEMLPDSVGNEEPRDEPEEETEVIFPGFEGDEPGEAFMDEVPEIPIPEIPEIEPENTPEPEPLEFPEDCPIESMNLPVRVSKALERAGYRYAGQFIRLSDEELLRIRNLGAKGVTIIREWTAVHIPPEAIDTAAPA